MPEAPGRIGGRSLQASTGSSSGPPTAGDHDNLLLPIDLRRSEEEGPLIVVDPRDMRQEACRHRDVSHLTDARRETASLDKQTAPV